MDSHAQDAGVALEPYDGPPVFLESPPESVPATRIENKVNTEKYANGKVWIERGLTRFSDNSFISDGVYREFYPDGQQFVDGAFEEGEPTGEWTYWHPNGQLAKKVSYVGGQPDGEIELLRADGTLEARKSYKQGKRDGAWDTFDDSGEQMLTHTEYQDGMPSGLWKWWFPSGQLQRETTFEEGQMSGVAKEWSEDGQLRAEVNFKDGKRHGLSTQWTPDGRKIEMRYEDGAPVRDAS